MRLWRGRSLHSRLTVAGALAILTAVTLAAAGLSVLFGRHVERVAAADLQARLFAIAAMVETEGSARPVLREVTVDPLYDLPFSGHYWQVALGEETLRSRSLWDVRLDWPADPPALGQTRRIALAGPRGEALLALESLLAVGPEAVPLRILTATDREEVEAARRGFIGDLVPFLAILGLLLVAGSWLQVRTGLGPLKDVSRHVASLRSAARARMGTDLPAEIMPLAQEIDLLLDERDQNLARARHRAADLAHGFKTPLQALLGDAAELRARGEGEMADSIEHIVTAMRTLVDRELTRARIRSDQGTAVADAARVTGRVTDVLRRTPAGRAIDWQIDTQADCAARIDADDLTEVMGAILENACRFAERTVAVTLGRDGDAVWIRVRDDGPGVGAADLHTITGRGVRLDQSSDGSGIGLAVAAEIIEAAGGDLSLRNVSPGLEVTVRLRAAGSGPAPAPLWGQVTG